VPLVFVLKLTRLTPPAEPLLSERDGATRIGKFHEPQDGDSADLSPLLEDTMQLRKEVPLELVVNMFRKLVSSFSTSTADDDRVVPTDARWICIRTCGTSCLRGAVH